MFLIPAEPERNAAVSAKLINEPHLSRRVAERDQPLSKKLHTNGRAIGFRQLLGNKNGDPEAAHQDAERFTRASARQKVVLFRI
jgi:hypothetical protein